MIITSSGTISWMWGMLMLPVIIMVMVITMGCLGGCLGVDRVLCIGPL